MKNLAQNKYQKSPKHRGTHLFHPGNKVPAYHSSGLKTYKKILSPLRDLKIINLQLLSDTIKKVSPANDSLFTGNSIILNNTEIILENGLANVKQLRFRFRDLRELLEGLYKERILNCTKDEVFFIENRYKKSCLKR